jgi:hypothetical protein
MRSDLNILTSTLSPSRIAILELSTNKLRPIEAAAAQLRDVIEKISRAEFCRLEIPQ